MDTADADPHRPRQLEDMAGAGDWARLKATLQNPDPPHLVLVGPAGIGKSCALRLCLDPKTITVWLRCSQDPTLRDNRDRIKAAARRRIEQGKISWIILEHADALHTDAQAFLRRIIETTMGSSRFILEVRDAAAIAEPLLSRTVLYNAQQLVEYEIRAEIQKRAPAVTVAEATTFAATCDGNVRWAVLQGLGSLAASQYNGFLDPSLSREKPTNWKDLLHIMETISATGSSPRAYSRQNSVIWDRAGGICPWAVLALELSAAII